MPTTFLTGVSQDVKDWVEGTRRENRYTKTNSRNRNLKIIRAGDTIATQNLGIDAPTVAPTGTVGTGANLEYAYVYVNKKFIDPFALGGDPFIRSNRSPALTIASKTTKATLITPTLSTDTQVTHIWLYVRDSTVSAEFYRRTGGVAAYEVANTGSPTFDGVIAVTTAEPVLETDNEPPDTCQIAVEGNGFYSFAGFVPITGNGTIAIGGGTITVTTGTMYDGVRQLNLQFSGDTTGGPNGDGIFLVNYATSTTLSLVNADGTADTYDGPANKTAAAFRIWRADNIGQISKRFNPDATPGIVDLDFIIDGPGRITGIVKPASGFAQRWHYNSGQKKSVEIIDFTEGVPPRRFTTASEYAMAAPRCYAQHAGRIFYFDISVGFVEDKGVNHEPVSQGAIPNLVRSLSASSAAAFEMEYDEHRNLLMLACAPGGYNRNFYLIVFNLISQTWNLWFMLPDVYSMRKIYDANGIPSIWMGSSFGAVTVWPSEGFNEAVPSSISGTLSIASSGTNITDSTAAFPTTGSGLKDRWLMTWNDADDVPTYQFAHIRATGTPASTATVLECDEFINTVTSAAFSPTPAAGDSYWIGPIQSILGPMWDFNAVPDADGQVLDVSVVTDGLSTTQAPRIELYRDLETASTIGKKMTKNLYVDGTIDPTHQSWKSGVTNSIEATGITGVRIVDNNEVGLSLKTLIKRVRAAIEQRGGRP